MQPIKAAMDAALASATTTAESKTRFEPSAWRPNIDAHCPSLVQAAASVAEFVLDMSVGIAPYWLTLSGPAGTGKTMLARQAFEQSRQYNPGRHSLWVPGTQTGVLRDEDRRPYCIWIDATKFSDRLKRGEYDLPESLRPDFMVVFDDLGASRDKTDFVPEAIYRLASARLCRWMIWTTNLTASEIAERLDQRIISRLMRDDNKFVTIDAPDYALHH